jgi:hypothetical protein
VKDVFHLLEADFNPLELCTKLAPLLEKLPALNAQVCSSRTWLEIVKYWLWCFTSIAWLIHFPA